MKILGIDPGSVNCGYGLITAKETVSAVKRSAGSQSMSEPVYISSGRIVMAASKPLHERLKELFESLTAVISELRPDEVVLEKMFFAKGIKAALGLAHTRGVALLAASFAGIPIHEYSPLEVKQAVVGYGRADKRQVQIMVRNILNIQHRLSPDGADALAIALCHMNMRGPCALVSNACNKRKGRPK
jgi:crossover junction endodeoxyribonuclease RuvC